MFIIQLGWKKRITNMKVYKSYLILQIGYHTSMNHHSILLRLQMKFMKRLKDMQKIYYICDMMDIVFANNGAIQTSQLQNKIETETFVWCGDSVHTKEFEINVVLFRVSVGKTNAFVIQVFYPKDLSRDEMNVLIVINNHHFK